MRMDEVAAEAVSRAESRAGIRIVAAESLAQTDLARRLFDRVWPSLTGGSQIQSNLLRALVHAGGYVGIAFSGEEPVGAAFAAVGRHLAAGGTWEDHLHSHMTATLPEFRDRGIGTAVKLHQRLWALQRQISSIRWTFDPLVRRNARLNLHHLGVEVTAYEIDFYGPMDDEVNAGDPSDRLLVDWRLDSERANRAALAPLPRVERSGDDVVVELPQDIVSLRSSDPHEARRWRGQVRELMSSSLAAGYVVAGLDADDAYVLRRSGDAG